MHSILKEAKSTIHKSRDNITRYYNQQHTSVSMFNPGNKVFLDFSNIHTTCFSTKPLHCYFGPYVVEKQIKPIAYYLKLSQTFQRLHLVFHVVKLTPILKDLISGRYSSLLPDSIIINDEEK